MSRGESVVVVGAGLAGLRSATALRERGFTGEITIVGDETHGPYDRPGLSKEVLTGRRSVLDTDLPLPTDLHARWSPGRRAVSLERNRRHLILDDGTTLAYDGLVIATGASARPWPGRLPRSGVHTLRGREDATALRRALVDGGPLLVVGAGLLGSEVASAARTLGLSVTLVGASPRPMERAVGPVVGSVLAGVQRAAGVDLRLGTTVTALLGRSALKGALLSDGTRVSIRTALLALGALPNTDWLRGSGLRLNDGASGGIACDHRGRALEADGRPISDIVALGDVAAPPHPLPHDGSPAHLNLGHWSEAVDHADTVAAALLGHEDPAHEAVPSFWSDQFDLRIRSVGLPMLAERTEIHEHDPVRSRLEATYHRGDRIVGALTVNRTSRLADHRRRIVDAWYREDASR
ncbi:NAD(P)/FAD-dependent oxidoreductase [Nocardiopsis alba]|uniref:NAD(P)/FAD-dependent oxidoreductase n=1 Tax=Nocardiopsis alba TaxID=53437 RepID=UPI00366DF44E